jgi:hypothetical protein
MAGAIIASTDATNTRYRLSMAGVFFFIRFQALRTGDSVTGADIKAENKELA